MVRRPTHGGGGLCAVLALGLAIFALFIAAEADARVNRWKVVEPVHGKILRIAQCESGGDWRIVSASGLYFGGLQFAPATWRSIGGRGMPHRASKLEQMYRGALLARRSGWRQWPICGLR